MSTETNDVRKSSHYSTFRIGADTDINNGRIQDVETTLRVLEEREDYVACLALYEALETFYKNKKQKLIGKL